jgi:hypothetical protein
MGRAASTAEVRDMKDVRIQISSAALLMALLFALAAPALALAAPGAGGSAAKSPAAASTKAAQKAADKAADKAAKTEALRKRIANVLRSRKARFKAASANLTKRISRVAALADKVEAAGGDVTGVRSKLAKARAHIKKSASLEARTASQFNAIASLTPSARKKAFSRARSTGRLAAKQLKLAKADLRAATAELKRVLKGLGAK